MGKSGNREQGGCARGDGTGQPITPGSGRCEGIQEHRFEGFFSR